MADDHRARLKAAALDETTFISLTLTGRISPALPWRRVVVRPLLLKGQRRWQVSHFDAKRDLTQNFAPDDIGAKLDELLALPFHYLELQTTVETLTVQIAPDGRPRLKRTPAQAARAPQLEHDTPKDQPIPSDRPDSFLQAVGLQTADGRIRADKRAKLAQINEFLKLMLHTGALERFDHTPLHIVDCGCGASLLTFAVHHYLNRLRGIPAEITGVDVNAALIARSAALSAELGLDGLCFVPSPIAEYDPAAPPDIVIALHACDTATDDALALGIRAGAGLILAAPCCHHDLHRQLEARPPFEPVLRHGILKQRFGDLLTDSFRALILRIMGYKTDVVQFVGGEHTDRNLMIRAVRRATPGDPAFTAEYRALQTFWGLTPYLETLLGESFTALLDTPPRLSP